MTAEKKELLLKESRVDFDRYLRKFVAEKKSRKGRMRETQEEKVESFKQKWAEFLVDEHNADDDIRPMLGLDAFDPKPFKLHGNYAVQSAVARNQATMNLMFDREMQRLKSNRDKVSGFFRDQQKWLADLKFDINTKFAQVPAVRTALPTSFNFYPSRVDPNSGSTSLLNLRNNLSDLIH